MITRLRRPWGELTISQQVFFLGAGSGEVARERGAEELLCWGDAGITCIQRDAEVTCDLRHGGFEEHGAEVDFAEVGRQSGEGRVRGAAQVGHHTVIFRGARDRWPGARERAENEGLGVVFGTMPEYGVAGNPEEERSNRQGGMTALIRFEQYLL